jgi:hypothetical protein
MGVPRWPSLQFVSASAIGAYRDTGVTGVSGYRRPANFGKFIAEETEKWAKVVKFAGIRAE